MVFTASLNLMVRKALPNKSQQKSISFIIGALPLSPTESPGQAGSGMEILILGPQDFRGAAATELPRAIESAHEDVCIIYICTNDKERQLCPTRANIKQVRKITPDVIKDAVTEFYGKSVQGVGRAHYSSAADKAIEADRNPTPPRAARPGRGKKKDDEAGPGEAVQEVPDDEEAIARAAAAAQAADEEAAAKAAAEAEAARLAAEAMAEPEPGRGGTLPQPAERALAPTPQQIIESARSIEDWDLFKQQLRRDSIMADALQRSSEFQGIQNMLSVFSVKMQDTISDSHMTNEQKLQALIEFGNNRAALAAAQNSRLVDDFLKVWASVTATANRIVEDRLHDINEAVAATKSNKTAYLEQVACSGAEHEKKLSEYSIELINIWGQMISLYKFAYNEANEEFAARLNEKLPSDNAYINAQMGRVAEDFRTANAENLVAKLFQGLQESRISMTQVQDKVSALLETLFSIIKESQHIHSYHREIMDCLRANNVENIVIRDTLMKDLFRIFVGTQGTGLTATVTMYAGMMSRRCNTLVVDLTGHSHYQKYGITTYDFNSFMEERIQQQLCVVTGPAGMDPEMLAKFMEECKTRMNYYSSLIVVLDASMHEELDQLGREALTINYVTNCTTDSLQAINDCYDKARTIPNVGTLLCTIDAPVDATIVVDTLHMDIGRTRLVLIPYLRDIKKAAIVGENPANYGDTLRVFEDAFRV